MGNNFSKESSLSQALNLILSNDCPIFLVPCFNRAWGKIMSNRDTVEWSKVQLFWEGHKNLPIFLMVWTFTSEMALALGLKIWVGK